MRPLQIGMVVTVAAILGLGLLLDRQERGVHLDRQAAEVSRVLNLLRADLGGMLAGDVQLLRGLVAALELDPEMGPEAFRHLARRLVQDGERVRNLAAAPDLVVRMIHPLEGNEAMLGRDYRAMPDQWATARIAYEERRLVMAGPLELVQGGQALVIRKPVIVPGEAAPWGLVAGVIDVERLYRDAGLLDRDLPIRVAIRGRDGTGAEGEVFFGDPAVFSSGPVLAPLDLPEGEWLLAAVPAAGWEAAAPNRWLTWTLLLGFGALLLTPLHLAGRLAEERRRAMAALEDRERELARLSRRLDLALTASTVGVWDYNIDRDELVWDARMNELYGMPEAKREHAYADWKARLHPADLAAAEATFAAAIGGRARYETQFRVLLPHGPVRHIRAIGAVYRDADGTSKIVGVNWDVTADVEREAELVEKRREAEGASVAKSRFLAQMSHEIRTPMSGVLGMLDLLLDGPLEAVQRSRAGIARASAATLLTILDDILDLSKLEADRVQLDPANVEIDRLVDEVVALFQPMAEQKGLGIGLEIDPGVPRWLVLDPVRLRQIVVNLLSNAVKFTEAGRIDVRVAYAARTARLTIAVADTGIGIAPADRDRLFEPFTQLDGGLVRGSAGSGLGLAISSRLAGLMGGEIRLDSEVGRGSTFTAVIAARRGRAPEQADGEAPVLVAPMSILLVEDNATNQLVVAAMLERAGHAVVVAADGLAALEALDRHRFDAILMDVEMPRMDGPAATRAIRARCDAAAALPIIALTANAMAGDRERYLAVGMSDYLTKPIDPRALDAALARADAMRRDPRRLPA